MSQFPGWTPEHVAEILSRRGKSVALGQAPKIDRNMTAMCEQAGGKKEHGEPGRREVLLSLPMPPTVNHYYQKAVMWPKGCWPKMQTLDGRVYLAGPATYRSKSGATLNVRPTVAVRVGEDGNQYRGDVLKAVLSERCNWQTAQDIRVDIDVHFRDARRQDIDNRVKPLLDALQAAGVFQDDNQVVTLVVNRRDVIKGGRVGVRITEVGERPAEQGSLL